jgi:hypothetical protein
MLTVGMSAKVMQKTEINRALLFDEKIKENT